MKVVVAAFYQEKALVEAFSVIAKTDGLFAALVSSIVNVTRLGSGLQLLATTRHWGIAKHEQL